MASLSTEESHKALCVIPMQNKNDYQKKHSLGHQRTYSPAFCLIGFRELQTYTQGARLFIVGEFCICALHSDCGRVLKSRASVDKQTRLIDKSMFIYMPHTASGRSQTQHCLSLHYGSPDVFRLMAQPRRARGA